MPRTGRLGLLVVLALAGAVGAGRSGLAQEPACPTAPLLASPTAGASPGAGTAADAERPVWQTIGLTDACSGDVFTLADFAGRTVYVEPMATWCPTCREQLENVREARERLADEEVVFVALSVETDLPRQDLADYAADAGFAWPFAVMTPEMLTALVEAFGRSIAVPPSTPHFVIRPDGSTTELETGLADADALLELLAEVEAG